MEFDKNRIYTMVNADEVKLGSVGYFADNIYFGLEKSQVESMKKDILEK